MPIDDLGLLLSRLKGVKKISTGYMALCPVHGDTHRSLSITPDKDNKALIYCHAGCQYKDILTTLNLQQSITPIFQPIIEETYDYTDLEGNVLYQVVRYHPKNFRQRRPDGNEWAWNLNGIERTLFLLPLISKSIEEEQLIWLVEGERDCISLVGEGFATTTPAGGAAAKWLPQYTEILQGADVAIIPDNDEAGQQRALRIAKNLFGWAKSIKIVHLPSDIQDTTDWLEKGHTAVELKAQYDVSHYFTFGGEITREDYFDLKGHIVYLCGKLRSHWDRKKDPEQRERPVKAIDV